MANSDYGAILLTTAEAVSQALNKRLEVSSGFKPSEWAENINQLVKPAVHTASGNVCHFTDGLDLPLVSLKTAITATQSGSGTPSPSNPRPISGFSAVNISHSGEDTSNPVIVNIPLGRDVFGGNLNVTTGVLEITHHSLITSFGADSGVVITDYKRLGIDLSSAPCDIDTRTQALCDKGGNYSASFASDTLHYYITGTGITAYIFLPIDIGAVDVQLVYPLATPITIQLTPTEITALLGVNNLWGDTGSSEVVYKARPS